MTRPDEDSRSSAATALIQATMALAAAGTPLMLRVVPRDAPFVVWDHYPPDDAVDSRSGSRWFYHAHPPEERGDGEHGHFHLFFDRNVFEDAGCKPLAAPLDGVSSGADVVHVIAIAIDLDGLPTRLFTVNRWVTDEWMHPAADILKLLPDFDLSAATGDSMLNTWLTAAVGFFRPEITRVLLARDMEIRKLSGDPRLFEDRSLEILSGTAIDINQAVDQAG